MTYDNENIFAKILRGEIPSHKVYEDNDTFALMDIMPRSPGHVLVIPKAPVRNMLDADPASLAATISTVQHMARAVKQAFAADGVTVQQANEKAGGQEVFHLHFHVLPRYDKVRMDRPGQMGDMEEIARNAARIRAVLEG
ncbi:MAG: HIT family protein [Rhodobacteraceae bacterium]|nr:HIT family protein [Paracoccaceae bacterium]